MLNKVLEILLRVGQAYLVIFATKGALYLIKRIPNPKPHIVLAIRR